MLSSYTYVYYESYTYVYYNSYYVRILQLTMEGVYT